MISDATFVSEEHLVLAVELGGGDRVLGKSGRNNSSTHRCEKGKRENKTSDQS
jgi:hypothetical protein